MDSPKGVIRMGSWFSDFPIPPCVSRSLRKEKRAVLEYNQRISVSFTPRGNPRKMLDITLAFIPHEHRQGGTQCNIWHPYGSKKAFIEHYNTSSFFASASSNCS